MSQTGDVRSRQTARGDGTVRETATGGNTHQNNRGRTADTLPHNSLIVLALKIFTFLLFFFFFVIPAVIIIFPNIIAEIAFLNRFQPPPSNIHQPKEFGLHNAYNFEVVTADGVTVGAWHILPDGLPLIPDDGTSHEYQNHLTMGNPVILYLHGNGGSRATLYRLELYKKLSSAGFHVITFDYRGYGDSTGSPSEEGLVEDSIGVFKWLKRQTGKVPVYIWGHSLGSAIATRAANKLIAEDSEFSGLILEGPFNNFIEAATRSPLSWPCRLLPWFSWVLVGAVKSQDIYFASDEHIRGITVPILILHSLDDTVIPYDLGQKLYDVAHRQIGEDAQMVLFDAEHGYGHEDIYKAPQLVEVIRKFMKLKTNDNE